MATNGGHIYKLRPDDEVEMARQLVLHNRLSEEMGGILPEKIDLTNVHRILDVACGAGAWLLDMARLYPYIQCIGIDKSKLLVDYANSLAWNAGLDNVAFQVQDMRSLDIKLLSPGRFGLVNISFIAGSVLTTNYSTLMATLFKLTRPGGVLRWTELELPVTNSPAFEELMNLTLAGLQRAGQTFVAPQSWEIAKIFADNYRERTGRELTFDERNNFGITPLMGRWLLDAGYHNLRHVPYAIEVSKGAKAHHCFYRQVWVFMQQTRPFLLEKGVVTKEKLEQLCYEVQQELQEQSFCGLCLVLTILGERP